MPAHNRLSLKNLLKEISTCKQCEAFLPYEPRPVVSLSTTARLLIVGQAPGTRVHETGVPWNDPSGDRLRQWMGISKDVFYDNSRVAIMPMGFCYPGKGKSGDLPPRKECAPLWHNRLLEFMPNIELTLLVGNYAQKHYLDKPQSNLTKTVAHWQTYLPEYLPLVHPSPRNTYWLQQNLWFEKELVPQLRAMTADLVK